MTYIEEYYSKMCSGEIIVGAKIKKLYSKIVDDIHNPKTYPVMQQDGEYKDVKFIFYEPYASLPIKFIEQFCKQSKAPFTGQPLQLELWQKALIQIVYGFVDETNGYRQYQEVLLEVGRKNGKSTIMSGLGAYHVSMEEGYEICCGANTRSQAEIIFQETKNMLKQNKILDDRVKKRKYDLYNLTKFNTMKPLANNSNLDGLNTDIFLVDEIHEFKDATMYDLIKQGQGVKNEPLIFLITTNGFVRDSFFDKKIEYANNVLNGIITDFRFLPLLYELDALNEKEANIEIKDKYNWIKTNPSLGTFRKYSDIDKLIKETEHNKTDRAKMLAKYFNLPQTGTSGWLTPEEAINTQTFDLKEFRGCYCVGGVDLSCVGDLTSASLIFMKPNSDIKYVLNKTWIPADLVEEKIREDKVPYDKWIDECYIDVSGKGNMKIDYTDVTNWFLQMVQTYNLYPRWIGYDNWNSQYWINDMKNSGFELSMVRQGFQTFSNPLKNLTADFQAKKIIYNDNKTLLWAILNTRIEEDKNANWRPVKGRNRKKRIDPLVSLLDAYVVLDNNYNDFINFL